MWKHIVRGCLCAWPALTPLVMAQVRDDGARWIVQPSAQAEIRYGPEAAPSFPGKHVVTLSRGPAAQEGRAWLLRYDLTGVRASNTAYAAIWIKGKASGPGVSPFLTVYRVDNDWDPASVTGARAPERRARVREVALKKNVEGAIALPVTQGMAEGWKQGSVSFLIEMRGAAGASQPLALNGEAPLTIVKTASCAMDEVEAMRPMWLGATMIEETVLPVAQADAPAEGNLAMTPTRVVSVKNYALDITYQEGRDYRVDGRTLRRPTGSTMPFLQYARLYHDDPDAQPGAMPTIDGRYLTFTESSFFNDHQVAVTYEHAPGAWRGPIPVSAAMLLPRTFAKLEAGRLKMVVYGDSISFGASASGQAGRPPYLPRWSDLLTGALRRHYKAEVDTVNASLGGSTSQWGLESAAGLVAPEQPDLVLLGFGMNDGSKVPAETFVANLRGIMRIVRDANPAAEFLLIMPFQPNTRWRELGLMRAYLERLRALEAPGVALADLWSTHEWLLTHKTYGDMTGNHVNHPNDFMVRVYAQVLAARLGVKP